MKIKNRHRLKSRDIRNLEEQINSVFNNISFDPKSVFEVGELEGQKIVFIDGQPCFFYVDDLIVFTLHGIEKFKPKNNYVVVDMGAVKFVTNGADVMAPGIVDADTNIKADDPVWICDERHHKPLAVGIAVMKGEEMKKADKGKSIKLVHYVGDMIWSFVAKSL